MPTKTLAVVLLLLAAMLATPPARAAAPAETIAELHAALIVAMKAGTTLDCGGRARRLAPVVAATFDFPTIARLLLRRHWSDMPPAQQQRYVDALGQLALANYAANFARHGGESFETLTTEESGAHRVVRTRLNRPQHPAVSLDYLLREVDGRWRVINVIAEGVSDLAIRSAQYDKAWREKGFDGLMAGLDEQIGRTGPGCAPAPP